MWVMLLTVGTLFLMVAAIVMTALMYSYFASGGCELNQFFITFNLLLCVIASLNAIHPRVQEENPQSGLPTAAFVAGKSCRLGSGGGGGGEVAVKWWR